MIVRVRAVDLAHFLGIVVIPDWRDLVWIIRSVALRQRPDQRLLDWAYAVRELECQLRSFIGRLERTLKVDRVERFPLLVVVGTGGVGDAPIGHGAGRVMLRSLAKTPYGLLMVVAVAPKEPAIEPRLSVRRLSRYRPAVQSEVVISDHLSPLRLSGAVRRSLMIPLEPQTTEISTAMGVHSRTVALTVDCVARHSTISRSWLSGALSAEILTDMRIPL